MSKQRFRKVFVFLDTEKHASPFDMLATIDVFPDAQISKYENVLAEDVEKIVYDLMFPRGPEGAMHTKIFINGRELEQVNVILEKARKCMFPPFELSIIVDPRGAYTTAAAAVAKLLELSLAEGFGGLERKRVTVLAGTGPVGQTAARLLASEKSIVYVTSRDLQRASAVAAKINEEVGSDRVHGIQADSPEEVSEAIKLAEIVLSAGAAATLLLPLNILKEYGRECIIVGDVNAIPPHGVEGLEPEADGEKLLPKTIGIGALAIGKLKIKAQTSMIRRAAEEAKGVFDYKTAYEIAKQAIAKRLEQKKAARVTSEKHWLP